ncbi:MAG: type II secretion system F family protein [Fuerstiella sp.]
MKILIALSFVALVLVGAILLIRHLWLKSKVQRHWDDLSQPVDQTDLSDPNEQGWLTRWMYLAGFRQSGAAAVFVVATAVLTLIGLTVALGVKYSGIQQTMELSMVQIPGGVGDTFLPVVWVAPWLILLCLALIPLLIVRSARRNRLQLIEQDLPLALELLSTLSEAGLGFDAGLSRILKTRLAGRPLAEEFRRFQSDLLAGRPRILALRRFSARMDIPSVSVFTSAMVQADQLGMGIARVLRLQADDVRSRRRERSIAFANSLATKRVIPLVVCFLPGLFVWTLGPAFVQLFKMAETFIQGR